jgi:hypothetical protein
MIKLLFALSTEDFTKVLSFSRTLRFHATSAKYMLTGKPNRINKRTTADRTLELLIKRVVEVLLKSRHNSFRCLYQHRFLTRTPSFILIIIRCLFWRIKSQIYRVRLRLIFTRDSMLRSTFRGYLYSFLTLTSLLTLYSHSCSCCDNKFWFWITW